MNAGPYALSFLDMGAIRLDGGAMFGVVPRALWKKHFQPDEWNRIGLACRGLLLRGDGRVIVVDTGAGARWTDKEKARYGVSNREVRDAVRDYGVSPEDVTHCVLTHLHFDHAGGAVTPEGLPAFPNARYIVQQRALDWARQPTERDQASFRDGDFEPLVDAGLLDTVDGPVTILPGIRVILSEGHTTALQIPVIGEQVIYPADLLPTSAHLRPSWHMGYDIRPLECVSEKRALLHQAAANGWTVVFEHDPEVPCARIAEQDGVFASLPPVSTTT